MLTCQEAIVGAILFSGSGCLAHVLQSFTRCNVSPEWRHKSWRAIQPEGVINQFRSGWRVLLCGKNGCVCVVILCAHSFSWFTPVQPPPHSAWRMFARPTLNVGAVSSSLTLYAAKCESSGSKFPWINITIWMRSVAREQNVVDYTAWWSERWWKTVWPRAAVALLSLSVFYIKRNIWLLVPNKDLKQPRCSPCWPNVWNEHLHYSLAPQ